MAWRGASDMTQPPFLPGCGENRRCEMAKPEAVFIYIGTYSSEALARADYDVVTPAWNFVAMGEVGLTGWHRSPLQPDVDSAGLRKGGVTEPLQKDKTMKTTILMSGARP
jgi:hypothetical protein